VGYAQLALFAADDEASTYHNSTRVGFFSLLVAANGGEKRQVSYRLTDMPVVLRAVDPTRDTWLSQAEFTKPNRRVVNLARIGLLFADLDTYRMPWAEGRAPEAQAESVLYWCEQEGMPRPSLIVFSGRGLQAKWLLEGTIPRQALPRWNACQRNLIDRLETLGADPAAKDASRVLRLVSTVNSKSGEVCHVLHVEPGENGQPKRYGFDYLAEVLLPVARWTIEQQRKERAERTQLKLIPSGKPATGLRGFSGRQLAWHRLEDLRMLAALRGGVKEGERMHYLFWQLNFLLLSGATHSGQMYHEAAALAREIDPAWGYRTAELMTLYAKAKQYEAGERISFGGREYPPLYTPKNDTLISAFSITDDEQRGLRTIISTGIARERDKDRKQASRRAAGAVERAAYVGAAEAKAEQARALRAEGFTVRVIAERMGVSVGAASGYLQAQA